MDRFVPLTRTGPIRIVQVGCGSMAQGWVERIRKRSDCEIVGLVDINPAAAEKTAAKHGLPPTVVHGSLPQALAATRPDAVVDITVPGAHHEVTMTALAAGCHVLGEKPLADTLPRAREMCAAAQKAQRLYMVTQNRRHMSTIIAFSEALRSGLIGDLSSLDADFFIGAHFGGFRDVMDNVLILDMAIHTFDQARFISGCDPVAVYCHEYNPKGSWYRGNAAAICLFEMSNGVVFTYRGSWAAEGFNTSWEAAWRGTGSKGTILWDGHVDPRAQLVQAGDGFTRPLLDQAIPSRPLPEGGHEGVLADFVRCVRSGEIPQTICTDNIKSLAMCFGAIESARTHQRVEIRW